MTLSICSVRAFDPASALIDQLRTSAGPKNDSDFDREIAYQIQVQNTIKKGVVQHWLDKAQGWYASGTQHGQGSCCVVTQAEYWSFILNQTQDSVSIQTTNMFSQCSGFTEL